MKKNTTYEQRKSRVAYLFLIPWIIGTVFFFFRPLVESVMYSLGTYEILDNGYNITITGFDNYREILSGDAEYVRNITAALEKMALSTPAIVLLSLFLAIILNQKFFGRTVARAVFFLPVLIGGSAIMSIINGDVISQSMSSGAKVSQLFQSSFLQSVLLESGLTEGVVRTATNLVDSVFQLIWKSGIQIMIFLAGLQTISDSLYEVAKIEGATAWECFWKVTFPMLSSTILINLIYTVVDSFIDFENPVMIQINSTTRQMFIEQSSAMAWFYFLIVLVVIIVVYALVNRHVFYYT